MRGKTILPVLALALAGTLSACGSSDSSQSTSAPSTAAASASQAAEWSATTSANATAGSTKDAPVGIRQTSLGRTLVTPAGRTLYSFDKDKGSNTSSCTAADCVAKWPPLLLGSPGDVTVSGLAKPVGTIVRPDGGIQATYRGLPLYTFAGDSAAGDTKGDGVGGVWHAVTLPAAASATQAATADSGSGGGSSY
ncbi:hypothetical protein [Frankia sp. CiP3]|uniref:COG4315 family predicted lipoprotein n=1 Tax=Frankia sp. CiP3 TaxID=2880971 RepID=UPI001EF5AA5C|nr:hypothetical protein [Frankia sp. CiP3]